MRAIQEARHRELEGRLAPIRTMGDAVISAFFAADKPRAREKRRAEVESWLAGSLEGQRDKLDAAAAKLREGEHPIPPFHWQIEFPEVFERENGGFDAVVGNPPFLGGTAISQNYGMSYFQYLVMKNASAQHHCDLVAYFFRRGFQLVREGGCIGLIATNTISQGDTREGGLTAILGNGGSISRAVRRLRWPGEAAVVVSVAHIVKGALAGKAELDGRRVRRISAYLVEGDADFSPASLARNPYFSLGSKIYGQGFLFDDNDADASPISLYEEILRERPDLSDRVKPYLGGEEVNVSPSQQPSRLAIYLSDLQDETDLLEFGPLVNIVREKVLPERAKLGNNPNNIPLKRRWWAYQAHRPQLYHQITQSDLVLCNSQVSPHLAFAVAPNNAIFAHTLNVIPRASLAMFSCIQSRVHEVWTRFFASTLEDRLRYTPSDCFRTFPFPENFETDGTLEGLGEGYHAFRAKLMIERNEGLTKTYNRFHARGEKAADIVRLRALHDEMDAAVLRAYGWNDLADRAAPEFIEQDADEGKTPKTRLDWPAEFKDEVLARLLALNAERAAAERAAGLTPVPEADEEDIDEEAVA